MEELHNLSELLIERETIDKDQFERLLAGESPESVFPEGEQVPAAEDEAEEAARRAQAAAVPAPGATMQPPPEPEGAK